MDTNLSINWIDTHGTDLQKARLAYVLFSTEPPTGVVRSLVSLQNKDGGFPFGFTAGNLSAIDQTLVVLLWLDELGLLESPQAVKTVHYLYSLQQDDGGWDESSKLTLYPLPTWIQPGDLRSRLYLTANTAFWLAMSGRVNLSGFHHALKFLIEHRGKIGAEYGYLHSTWIAAAVFLLAGRRYSVHARAALQYLSSIPLAEWASSQLAWALDYLSAAGLPETHPFVVQALGELVQRQSADGRWESEDGISYENDTIIEVLKVLGYYDLW
jgi:squalene cyclase